MATNVVDLSCRNCGAPVSIDTTVCKYCQSPVSISTFNSVSGMALPLVNKYLSSYRRDLSSNPNDIGANKATAYCYLKLKMYDNALSCFEKAVVDNFDDSETYFYAAICCLKGKKAFLTLRSEINKIEEFLNAATMIEPKGIYYYFWAYIKYDYFKRKFLQTTPDYMQMLEMAKQYQVSEYDVSQLFSILNVDNPFNG